MLHKDNRKIVITNEGQKGDDDSSCTKRARYGEEESTNCYEIAKYKTKGRIISFFIKKRVYYSSTRDGLDLLLKDPPLSYRRAKNDKTFVTYDIRHEGVQDISKKNIDKSVEPRTL